MLIAMAPSGWNKDTFSEALAVLSTPPHLIIDDPMVDRALDAYLRPLFPKWRDFPQESIQTARSNMRRALTAALHDGPPHEGSARPEAPPAPGHTDLMISPEAIDEALAGNPEIPDPFADLTRRVEAIEERQKRESALLREIGVSWAETAKSHEECQKRHAVLRAAFLEEKPHGQ
jgi:hypothetical protein